MDIQRKNIVGIVSLMIILLTQFTVYAQDSIPQNEIGKTMDKYLSYFSNDNPGAVVTVMKKGDVIFSKAYGLSNIETGRQMSANKVFNIAELSKSFTSLAVFKLVEKYKISIDDDLKQLFPDFPEYGHQVEIRNLLNHTSGLKAFDSEKINSNDEVYAFLKLQNETSFAPGTKWEYCNSDYAMLAKIIEKVSGMSYGEFLDKNIFSKLKMDHTHVGVDGVSDMAESHFKENGTYVVKNDVSKIFGEQGIYSNSSDMAKWDRALYSDKLLRCENLQHIFTVDRADFGDKKSYYGYGWVLMEKNGARYYWHGGTQHGYSNLLLHLPDTQTTVLILTNRNDGYDFLKMAIYIAKLFDKDLKL